MASPTPARGRAKSPSPKGGRVSAAASATQTGAAAGDPLVGAGAYFVQRHRQKKAARKAGAGGGSGEGAARGGGRGGGAPAGRSRARRAAGFAFSGNRKILMAEFLLCVLLLLLGTVLAPKGSKDDLVRALIKGTALSGVFLLLSLLAVGGNGAARTATALATLITASYVLTSSDAHNLINWITSFYAPPKGDTEGSSSSEAAS